MKKSIRITRPQVALCLVAVLLLACGLAAYYLDTLRNESTYAYIGRHSSGVGQLTATPVTQTFVVTENAMTAVEVMFSNYNERVDTGTLTLTLTDENGNEVARQDYPVAELKNNAFITLPLDTPASDSAGKTYTLSATSDCVQEKGVTLRMGPVNADAPAATLTLQDGTTDTENALNMRTLHSLTVYGWQGCYTLIALALCCLACLPLAGKEKTHA